MNGNALTLIVVIFLVYLMVFLKTLKLEGDSFRDDFREIFSKVICMAFALGIAYGFMNHPDQEPNTLMRYTEIVVPLVLSFVALII